MVDGSCAWHSNGFTGLLRFHFDLVRRAVVALRLCSSFSCHCHGGPMPRADMVFHLSEGRSSSFVFEACSLPSVSSSAQSGGCQMCWSSRGTGCHRVSLFG